MKLSLFIKQIVLLLLCFGTVSIAIGMASHLEASTKLIFLKSSKVLDNNVSGNVQDEHGEPLIGVNILVKGTNVGTVTNLEGNFELSNLNEDAILIFSYVGYASSEVSIKGMQFIEIILKEDKATLDEIVVIGYGEQSRQLVTTSISKLDTKTLENVPYSNVADAFKGSLPGVRVQSISGQPGTSPRIIVRGGTSINNPDGAAPLYVVDGVIRQDLDDLNSDDIESIQVLKDAASTAIYGARASNGVVIVVTKSGESGETKLSYNYDFTASQIDLGYTPLSAKDFIHYQRMGIARVGTKYPSELLKLGDELSVGTGNDLSNQTGYTTQYLTPENQHKLNEGWESIADPLDPTKTIIFKSTNWQDVLFRTGLSHDHNISASGGSEKTAFNIGLGYQTNEGIAKGSDYNRLSLNLNGSLKARDNLSIFGRLLYSNSNVNAMSGVSVFLWAQGLAPTAKYRFEDGTLSPGPSQTAGNPDYVLNTIDNKDKTDNLTMVLGADWELIPNLHFQMQISRYMEGRDLRSFREAYFTSPTVLNESRNASGYHSERLQHQVDASFSYAGSLNNTHNYNFKIGTSYFGTQNSLLSASGRGAASDLIPTLNAASEILAINGIESEQVIAGYFSRFNYDFNQKYLFSMTGRYDGASNLGNNYRWGFFPGVSVGWNVHKEKFFNNSRQDVINRLKLRTSYGINGNISGLGPYQSGGQYQVGDRYFGDPAIINSIISNPDLQWEQSKTIDIGADIGLIDNRISIMVDYYRRITDNLITNLQLPHSTGFNSIATNLGSLENKGVELELSASVLPNKSPIYWSVSFNTAKVSSKVLKLPENGVENNRVGGIYIWDSKVEDYKWTGGIQEGTAVGNLYAYKQVGIYATDEEAAAGPIDMIVPGTDKTKYGGDVNWFDSDGNDIIDEKDRVYVGNIYPKWTGGFSNELSYSNLTLVIRTDYMTGHTAYNYARASTVGQFSGEQNLTGDILNSWENQGDITDIPRFVWADRLSANVSRGNSKYYEAGDFIALREVTLSYSVPDNLINTIGFSRLRFNISGQNLHYFTNSKSALPEFGGSESLGRRYPLPRNIIFGVKANFK